MKRLVSVVVCVSVCLVGIQVKGQHKNKYMGGGAELSTMPNGGVINKKAAEKIAQTWPDTPKIVYVAEGVWSLEGYAHVNCGVVEGATSLIVYDTGNDYMDGQKFLNAIRQVSDKPIKTIIYSHAHYVWGSKPLLENAVDYTVIGHSNLNKNILESGGTGATIPELAPVLTARAYEQFDVYTPNEGPDAPLASSPLGSSDKEYIPVTMPVENGQEIVLDGVRMQFFTEYHSDTDDCLMVYFPDKGLVMNNLYWPVFPNLYTLRGAVYRDPTPWMEGLRVVRDLNPEYLISTHTFAINGKDKVLEAITNYHDGLAYVYDQTLRGILNGATPKELQHSIQLPEHLASWPNNQLTYGELGYYPVNIYYHALGWYNGNAANINPVHPDIEAKKIVEGFGGKEKTMEAIKQAMENKEYAWATQLSDYLFKVFPKDPHVRQIKADALRKMGQLTMASIPRSWYLSQARALENVVEIPHAVMPSEEAVLESAPGTYVNLLRVRIDPQLSTETDQVIAIGFTDIDSSSTFGLHIRKGIVEYIPNVDSHYQKAEVGIYLPRTLFAAYYVGNVSLEELINNKAVQIKGGKSAVKDLLSQLDTVEPNKSKLKFH